MPSPKPLAAFVDTKLESPIHPAARGKAAGIVHAREAKGSRPDNPNRVSEETSHRTYKNGCPESVFRIYCARTTCVSAGSLSLTSMLTIRARVFSGLGTYLDDYSRIPLVYTFDSYILVLLYPRVRRAFCGFDLFRSWRGVRLSSLFSTSSFPLALPLGRPPAPPSTPPATGPRGAGGNHGGTPGITHFSPAGAHGHAGAGPSATQVSRHPLMRTLYTLDSLVSAHVSTTTSASIRSSGRLSRPRISAIYHGRPTRLRADWFVRRGPTNR